MEIPTLTNERRNAIAFELIKLQVRQQPPQLDGKKLKRRIGTISHHTGIPKEELMAFAKMMADNAYQEVFGTSPQS